MARKSREEAMQQEFREAADLVKERGREMRAAERLDKRANRQLHELMLVLNPYLKLSKKQEADLKAAADARNATHERSRAANKAWLAAIDKMILAGEAIAKHPRKRTLS